MNARFLPGCARAWGRSYLGLRSPLRNRYPGVRASAGSSGAYRRSVGMVRSIGDRHCDCFDLCRFEPLSLHARTTRIREIRTGWLSHRCRGHFYGSVRARSGDLSGVRAAEFALMYLTGSLNENLVLKIRKCDMGKIGDRDETF